MYISYGLLYKFSFNFCSQVLKMNIKLSSAVSISDNKHDNTIVRIVYYIKSERCFMKICDKYKTSILGLSLTLRQFQWLCKSLDSGHWKGSLKTNRNEIFYRFDGLHYYIYQKTPRFKENYPLSVQEVRNMIHFKNAII